MQIFVKPIAKEAGKQLAAYLGRNDVETLQSLKRNMEVLGSRAIDIQAEVGREEMTSKKKRKAEVDNWLNQVADLRPEFNELETRMANASGGFPLIGDPLGKMLCEVEKLLHQSHHFNGLVLDVFCKFGEPCLPTKLFGKKMKENLERIWPCLVVDDVSRIGIYGMGGVGKTALAKNIKYELEKRNYRVCWVIVSQEFSVRSLQNKIARVLDIPLSNEDEEETRANILRSVIIRMEKLFFIFDDVWKEFFLETIGVPLGSKKCKLILTTRSLQLCHGMRCQRQFNVTTLDNCESWDLFRHTLGPETVLSAEVEEVAKSVAKRCAGLPLAVNTVAGSMRGVMDIREWRNSLEQLKSSSIGYEEMEDKVFPILEWSFNRLKGCEMICFLYCCLYPEDLEIRKVKLTELFSWAELLVPKRSNTEAEFDYGHAILNKLVKGCLLEETKNDRGDECVKMHDLIRDMAIRIASRKSTSNISPAVPRFLVKCVEFGSQKLVLEQHEWTEDLKAVSLILNCKSIEIPPGMSPISPNLSTLILTDAKIETFPDSFFEHMIGLKVVSLQDCVRLKELPYFVSNLTNLTALLLKGCWELRSIPPLRKLKKLRVLDLSFTRIADLPQGLEELVQLERFYLKLRKGIVPKRTFSNLRNLQHLVLAIDSQICDPEVLNHVQICQAKLGFGDFLNQVRTSRCWPKDYHILIGDDGVSPVTDEYDNVNTFEKNLDFRGCNFQTGFDPDFLPVDIQELTLNNCFGLSDVFLWHLLRRLKQLFCLNLWGLKGVEFLLNFCTPAPSLSPDDQLSAPLQNLEVLELRVLPNLFGLVNFEASSSSSSSEVTNLTRHQNPLIPPGTFSSLRILRICGCQRLRKLFPMQLVQQSLQNLERLYAIDCEELEEIIFSNDDDPAGLGGRSEVRLPKLQYMLLCVLPSLQNICSATMICDSIQRITAVDCPKVKKLPLFLPVDPTNGRPIPPKNLKCIRGNEEWWESLQWDSPGAKDSLQPFFCRAKDYPGRNEVETNQQRRIMQELCSWANGKQGQVEMREMSSKKQRKVG